MSALIRSVRDQPAAWASVVVGPLAWFAYLNLSYLLVPVACRTGDTWFLHLATVGAAGVTAGAGWLGWVRWRQSGMTIAGGGALLSALFLVTIVVMGVANGIVGPCR